MGTGGSHNRFHWKCSRKPWMLRSPVGVEQSTLVPWSGTCIPDVLWAHAAAASANLLETQILGPTHKLWKGGPRKLYFNKP